MAGKTGADAIFRALSHICGTIKRYAVKLHAVIAAAEAATIITPSEGVIAHAFVDAANVSCLIWQKIAEYNSITP